MKTTVLIAEKPDMAKAFSIYLKKRYSSDLIKKQHHYEMMAGNDTLIITWAYGHLFELANPAAYGEEYVPWSSYPVYPSRWKLSVDKGKMAQFKAIKSLLSTADEVIHGGDPDREGQLLIDEILTYCSYRGPVKRLLANAKDEMSLKRAFDNLRDNADFANLSDSALGRERADWLVGMNLTRAYTVNSRNAGYQETFKIGRVKTPTLALVVEREKEIKNFKSVKHYALQGTFEKNTIQFTANYVIPDTLSTDPSGRVLDASLLKAVQTKLSGQPVTVTNCTVKDGTTEPPLPYSLDTLQITANRIYGYSPKDVLAHVQSMYEKSFLSYPRSDCNYIPTSQLSDAPAIFTSIQSVLSIPALQNADFSRKSRAFNDKKITAHHAIIPTAVAPSGLSEEEKNIYTLIALQYAIQFFPPQQWKKTEFTLSVAGETFRGSGTTILDAGYKTILGKSIEEESEDTPALLPELSTGDAVTSMGYTIKEGVTKPPKRFTEGTLVKAMSNIYQYVPKDNPLRAKLKEVKGLGTPATRDTIIADLLTNSAKGHTISPFLTKKGKELVPTEWGTQFISIIDPSLSSPLSTASMEMALADVEQGKLSLDEYLSSVIAMIEANIKNAESIHYPDPVMSHGTEGHIECPICKDGYLVRKRSKSKENSFFFWVCSNEECKSPHTGKTVFYRDGKKGPVVAKCPACQAILEPKKGQYGVFWSCSNQDCRKTFSDKNGEPDFSPKKKPFTKKGGK